MLEGGVVFTSAATRRFETQTPARASAPFTVFGRAAGYASAGDSDKNARGEQWMPLWTNPITLDELHRLLAEGRAQLGRREATEPLDFARAVARLGTARGINAFQRFGYIERTLAAKGRTLESATLEEMDKLWDEAKGVEKAAVT